MNENKVTYFATNNFVTVLYNGERWTMSRDDSRYSRVMEDLRAGALSPETIPQRFAKVPETWHEEGVTLENGILTVQDPDTGEGLEVNGALYERLKKDGPRRKHLIAFIRRCLANPRPEAVLELYDFLEATHLPIAADGSFYAYKKVREDLTDIYTGTFSNAPGEVVEMPREDVDDNREQTCSTGLHFAGYDYLPYYGIGHGTTIVLVKVDPADVVAIPTDYNNQKGRAWRYEVVAEIGHNVPEEDRIEGSWYEDEEEDEGSEDDDE